jgi:hypothetical protein
MPSFQIGKSFQQEVRNARMVGEFAVKVGVARIPGLVLAALRKAQTYSGPRVIRINPDAGDKNRDDLNSQVASAESAEISVSVEPIAGYDVLTTQQVIDAYSTLSANERATVFIYERSRRARTAIMQRYGDEFGSNGS